MLVAMWMEYRFCDTGELSDRHDAPASLERRITPRSPATYTSLLFKPCTRVSPVQGCVSQRGVCLPACVRV